MMMAFKSLHLASREGNRAKTWGFLPRRGVNILIKYSWLQCNWKDRPEPCFFVGNNHLITGFCMTFIWILLMKFWLLDWPTHLIWLLELGLNFDYSSVENRTTQASFFQRPCFGLHSLSAVISSTLNKLLISMATECESVWSKPEAGQTADKASPSFSFCQSWKGFISPPSPSSPNATPRKVYFIQFFQQTSQPTMTKRQLCIDSLSRTSTGLIFNVHDAPAFGQWEWEEVDNLGSNEKLTWKSRPGPKQICAQQRAFFFSGEKLRSNRSKIREGGVLSQPDLFSLILSPKPISEVRMMRGSS